jgi:hypothetical protein
MSQAQRQCSCKFCDNAPDSAELAKSRKDYCESGRKSKTTARWLGQQLSAKLKFLGQLNPKITLTY